MFNRELHSKPGIHNNHQPFIQRKTNPQVNGEQAAMETSHGEQESQQENTPFISSLGAGGFIQKSAANGCNNQTTGVGDPDARFTQARDEAISRVQSIMGFVRVAPALPNSSSNPVIPHLNRVFNCPDQAEMQLISSYYEAIANILPNLNINCNVPIPQPESEGQAGGGQQQGEGSSDRDEEGNLTDNTNSRNGWTFNRTSTGWDVNFEQSFFAGALRSRAYTLIQAAAHLAGVPFKSITTFFDYSVASELYVLNRESYALLPYLFTGENPYPSPEIPPCEAHMPGPCSTQGTPTGRFITEQNEEGQPVLSEIRQEGEGSRFICIDGTRRELSEGAYPDF